MRILLSAHAVGRYHERVKPALERDAAEAELRALVKTATVTHDPPPWAGYTEAGVAWAIVADGIALALGKVPGGYRTITCLCNGGLSEVSRERRTERKRIRRERARRRATRARRVRLDTEKPNPHGWRDAA